MSNVVITHAAIEDLKRISDWLQIIQNKEAALQTVNHILDVIEKLECNATDGSLMPDGELFPEDFRMVVCEKYIIIYKIDMGNVFVDHIVDAKKEYGNIFM